MSSYNSPKPGGYTPGARKIIPLMGIFQDGKWFCNCNPRLPAAIFEAKKETKNKGRWFYTCQRSQCKMFLWRDSAIAREKQAVLDNTRSEPEPARKQTITHGTSNLEEEEDEFGLSQEDEASLTAAAVSLEEAAPSSPPETPRKVAKFDPFTTPGSKRKRDADGLPTPQTQNEPSNVFISPTKARLKGLMWDGNEHGMRSPSATPTPGRFRDAAALLTYQDNTQNYDITDKVMELLKDQHIDEVANSKLKELLNKHALRISGIAKGRDTIRIGLKKKDETIEELKNKISMLELQQSMDKAVIKHLRDSIAGSVSSKNAGATR
ncbi:hypothetical protein B0O99DRAFT_207186 [Bisporella sp. PMI_857]|nr:hypothetical protein B0O99DRAFT_207186 [Bisporella sp. PMI_857]